MILGGEQIYSSFNSNGWSATRDGMFLSVSDMSIGPNSVDVTLGNQFSRPVIPQVSDTEPPQRAVSVPPYGVQVITEDDLPPKPIDPSLLPDAVDPHDPQSLEWERFSISHGDSIILHPGEFLLGHTREAFDCSNPIPFDIEWTENVQDANGSTFSLAKRIEILKRFAPMYEGRSTLGRLGIASHITAGFGDYGFNGQWTLELFCSFPIPVKLYAGMRIGQVYFHEVDEPRNYAGAYMDQSGPRHPELGPHRF